MYAAIPYAVAVTLCVCIGTVSDRLLRGDVGGGRRRYMVAGTLILAAVILLAPLVQSVEMVIALIGLSLTGIAATTALNYALLADLTPSAGDMGVAMAFLVVGGNAFGLLAPIVTGYVISATGSYDMAFVIAGTLLVTGAGSVIVFGRRPIAAAPGHPANPIRIA